MTEVRALPVDATRSDEILTDEALAFVADLQRRFGPIRDGLLQRRVERRDRIARDGRLDTDLPKSRRPRTVAINESLAGELRWHIIDHDHPAKNGSSTITGVRA